MLVTPDAFTSDSPQPHSPTRLSVRTVHGEHPGTYDCEPIIPVHVFAKKVITNVLKTWPLAYEMVGGYVDGVVFMPLNCFRNIGWLFSGI